MHRLTAATGSQAWIGMIPPRQLFDRTVRFINLRVLLCILFPALLMPARQAPAQVPATIDTEALRRRDENAEQERRQRQQAPAARLLPEPDERDTDSKPLPSDTSCFPVQRIVLTLPERLPGPVREAGLRHLAQGPFQQAQAYLERYQEQCLGPAAISELAARIGRRILAQGYSTTRIMVPEQDLSAGTLTLALLPGIIGTIRFADSAQELQWRTAFPAAPGDLLNLRDLEQGLEQMKRLPSQEVDIDIMPGGQAGESDVILRIKRGKPWRLTASLDDGGARSTGKLQAGLQLALDGPLGLNDMLSAGILRDADRAGAAHGTGGGQFAYALPFGYWDFSLLASRHAYHQRIAGYNQTFMSSGQARNLEWKVQRLFQRDQTQKNSWQFRLGKRWSQAYIDDTEIALQRRHATFAEFGWLHRHYLGASQLDLTLATRWGVSWFNGQRDPTDRPPDAPTLRYTLHTLDAALTTPFRLAGHSAIHNATLRLQTSRSPLYLSEQFSIGGRYTVRGFSGETVLAGERGFYLRNDVSLPLAGSAHAVYLGLDAGQVAGPATHQLAGKHLAGAALGLRGNLGSLSYDLFAGWPLKKPPGFAEKHPVFGFNLSVQY